MRRGLVYSRKFSLIIMASMVIGMLLLGFYLRPSHFSRAAEEAQSEWLRWNTMRSRSLY